MDESPENIFFSFLASNNSLTQIVSFCSSAPCIRANDLSLLDNFETKRAPSTECLFVILARAVALLSQAPSSFLIAHDDVQALKPHASTYNLIEVLLRCALRLSRRRTLRSHIGSTNAGHSRACWRWAGHDATFCNESVESADVLLSTVIVNAPLGYLDCWILRSLVP